MEQEKIFTVDEKLDVLNKRMKHIQWSTDIQTAIIVIGFLGILTFGALIAKVKNSVHLK